MCPWRGIIILNGEKLFSDAAETFAYNLNIFSEEETRRRQNNACRERGEKPRDVIARSRLFAVEKLLSIIRIWSFSWCFHASPAQKSVYRKRVHQQRSATNAIWWRERSLRHKEKGKSFALNGNWEFFRAKEIKRISNSSPNETSRLQYGSIWFDWRILKYASECKSSACWTKLDTQRIITDGKSERQSKAEESL